MCVSLGRVSCVKQSSDTVGSSQSRLDWCLDRSTGVTFTNSHLISSLVSVRRSSPHDRRQGFELDVRRIRR